MNENVWSRFPHRQPQLSWFEFLLDRSGRLLKDHIKSGNADPSNLDLCKQFLQKSIIQHQHFAHLPQAAIDADITVNQKAKQLRCLALVVASYNQWDLDEIQESIPLFLQHLLMTELLRNYGITEANASDFKPESMDKRTVMVWILFHRWIVRSFIKSSLNKGVEKSKPRNCSVDNVQDEQISNMLVEFLPHSIKILNQCLTLNYDMEIPFPKWLRSNSQENGNSVSSDTQEMETNLSDQYEMTSGFNGGALLPNDADRIDDRKSTNIFDECISVKSSTIISQINIDLGSLHFFREDYNIAFKMFDRVFHPMQRDLNLKVTKKMKEAKGYYIASAMICNISVNMSSHLEDKQTLLFRAEKCSVNNLEALLQILIEDNKRKELTMSYRQDLELLVLKSQRKDIFFKIMACNAVRITLDGDLLRPSFLSSLKFINKAELFVLIELCADALSVAGSDQAVTLHVKRLCKTILPCLSPEFGKLFANDIHLQALLEEKEVSLAGKEADDLKIKESLDSSSMNSSILLSDLSGYNFKDDPCFIKREILLSTNAEYLKKLVSQLNLVNPSKDNFMAFECPQYTELLSEIRDPNVQALLHLCITKARLLAVKQNIGASLSLLSSALDVLNQFSIKSGSTSQSGRVKNVIHHEILFANVQRELRQSDSSISTDTLRLCKACHHHRDQDPLPRKCIYLNIVSYLLNKKEWQFLIEEGGNFEGITDFIELGYELAAVSVGLSKAGDVVKQHALKLWNTVVNIVCDATASANNSLMTFERSTSGARHSQLCVSRKDFLTLIATLKNNTVLSVLASCLTAILNVIKKDEQVEVKTVYGHIWPTSMEGDQLKIKISDVLCVLRHLFDRIITLDPCNIPWLKNRADVYFVEERYRDAIIQYLEVGGMTSNGFSVPVPFTVWDDQVYQRMIVCCLKQKRYSEALILCQFVEPIDYSTVLKVIQEMGSCGVTDTIYDCIWDVTILEFLIHAHSKRGEVEKKLKTIKTVNQPELNSCNSPDTLKQSANQRMSRFLRFLANAYWN